MKTLRRLDPILIQATIAAALSFAHLHDIADAAGQGGWKAWAYPVSVDLLMVMAWRRIRSKDVASKKAPWFWFLLSLAASLSANVATADVLDLANVPVALRVVVAGWPAVAFLGGSLLVHSRKPAEEAEELPAPSTPREAPPQEPQAPVSRPLTVVPDAEGVEDTTEPQKTVLVSYRDAADALGIAVETVRGWANNGTVKKYDGPTRSTRCVDLVECKTVQARRVAAGV